MQKKLAWTYGHEHLKVTWESKLARVSRIRTLEAFKALEIVRQLKGT